jgi:hypothetical protein
MIVLIDSLCLRLLYTYGWLIVVSLDDSIKTNFIIWEAPGQCGIRASTRRRGAYGMNIIKRVSKKGNHIIMETSEPHKNHNPT